MVFRTLVVVVTLACACAPADDELPVWDDLDRDERIEFMTHEVEPRMRDIFQAHDTERFAAFGCPTCHGTNFVDVDYAMPNAVSPLPLENTLEVAMMRDAAMTELMLDEVFPTMVELLGREKYHEVTTPDGFRCTGCHLVEQ